VNDFLCRISVENISKKFCRTLKRSLWYGVKDMGTELIGRSNNHKDLRKGEFWALEDISFRLGRGDSLGLIGHNGAGKTTLLRMLTGLIKPDSGRIEIAGRLQALIALGAGFNPVLTGRENVYVNGAVLGLSKVQIDERFDQILEFSGIEEFINMPVQSYSSGMAVRLGFAVAAHLDPDILLVDEVLAVGDLSFQAKCRKRIQQLFEKGVIVILVSHNMHAINHLCERTIVLENSHMVFDGETSKAIDIYRERVAPRELSSRKETTGTGEIKIARFEILNEKREIEHKFQVTSSAVFRIHYHANEPVQNPVFNIPIHDMDGNSVTGIRSDVDGLEFGILSGNGYIDLIIEHLNLLPNIYTLSLVIFHRDGFSFYDRISDLASLQVTGGHRVDGIVYLPHRWNHKG
jgi:lipopolysaccharide transport system ATP-binding protein